MTAGYNVTGRKKVIPVDLQCEYADSPIGLDTVKPRFSWKLNTGKYQEAYRLLVSSSPHQLSFDIGDMWDSGRVSTSQACHIQYQGLLLKSRKGYWWKVQVWVEGQKSDWSQIAYFEMGLLNSTDWNAEWIGLPLFGNTRAYIMRRAFHVDKEVKRARIYVSGVGYSEVYVNGSKIGDHVLDPANTDYAKRVLYTTYELETSLICKENVIAVLVANGWYKKPSLLLQLYLEFADGSEKFINTKPFEWDVIFSPYLRADIYTGEIYDARMEINGWNKPDKSFYEKRKLNPWLLVDAYSKIQEDGSIRVYPAMLLPAPGGRMESQKCEPIKAVQEIKPEKIYSPTVGIYVVSFPQNFSGWVRIRLRGERGKKVIIKYSELVFDDGTINQDYLSVAEHSHGMQTDIYIMKGDIEETYEPKFTYHGFKYVQIEGLDIQPDMDSIVGVVVHTDLKATGSFHCSNELINKIQECVIWSEKTNNHSILTDCPQRDERQGWLNDLTARAEEAVYNFNMARVFEKFTRDIMDTQDSYTGSIADTAPHRRAQNPADPVCVSYLLLPWLSYLFYGNKRLLTESYEGLKKWTKYLYSMTYNGIVMYSYWGDWASPQSECIENTPVSKHTPGILMSTGYLYYCFTLLSKMANILCKPDDMAEMKEKAVEIGEAFNRKFFNRDKGYYGNGSQGANAFALYLGLVPKEYINVVVDYLVNDIEKNHNGHLSTGNLCTKYLLEVLSEYGKVDTAFKIATQTTYPSWGYMLQKGATTIWERWEYETGASMNSHNHAMYGSISAWFYKYLAGIVPREDDPAFGSFIVRPHIPAGLDRVSASLDTIKGKISVSWNKSENGFELFVVVPANSNAHIYLPIAKHMNNDKVEINEKIAWKKGDFYPVSGITNMEESENEIIFHAVSGEYRLCI